MTLKINRAPLLSYFKLCASFCDLQWIQNGVTVRKRPIWVKIRDFFVQCDLEIWQMTLKNNRAHLLCYCKLCIILYPPVNSKWSYGPENLNWGKIYFDLCNLDLWPLTLTFCMDVTFINGNNSWKFHDDTMIGKLWKRWHRRTNRRKGPFIELLGPS